MGTLALLISQLWISQMLERFFVQSVSMCKRGVEAQPVSVMKATSAMDE